MSDPWPEREPYEEDHPNQIRLKKESTDRSAESREGGEMTETTADEGKTTRSWTDTDRVTIPREYWEKTKTIALYHGEHCKQDIDALREEMRGQRDDEIWPNLHALQDRVLRLQKEMRGQQTELGAMQDEIKSLRPSPKPLDWSEDTLREESLRLQRANAKIAKETHTSLDDMKRELDEGEQNKRDVELWARNGALKTLSREYSALVHDLALNSDFTRPGVVPSDLAGALLWVREAYFALYSSDPHELLP